MRIADYLERNGKGLNLTAEVRDGILNHQTSGHPFTLEGQIVRLSDKIAYCHHDMDDAIRGGILEDKDVPSSIGEVIGFTLGERLDTFIHDIITTSRDTASVRMSEPVAQAMKELRSFMFARVYTNPKAKGEERKAEQVVERLYEYYLKHLEELPEYLLLRLETGDSRERVTCDYISSMTDHFAVTRYEDLFVPKTWSVGGR